MDDPDHQNSDDPPPLSDDKSDNESWRPKVCRVDGQCHLAAILLVILGIIILGIFYWLSQYLKTHSVNSNDWLGKGLSAVPGSGTTFWELTHLVLFFVLGFIFPFCDAIVIAIGALWEMIEHFLGLNFSPIIRLDSNGNSERVQWWYGSAVDIAVNIVGFYIGKSIRLLLFPPIPPRPNPSSRSFTNSENVCKEDDIDIRTAIFTTHLLD